MHTNKTIAKLGRRLRPTVEDGAETMKFIAAALQSSRSGGWVDC